MSSKIHERVLFMSWIAISLMNSYINGVASADTQPSTGVDKLVGISCQQVQVILEEKIKALSVLQDLQVKMRYSIYRQDCWPVFFPECKSDIKQQSPINIITKNVLYYAFPPLIMANANISIDYGMMGNIYKDAQFRVVEDIVPTIRGGPLPEGVVLSLYDIILITDGETNKSPCQGSEHALNGQKFAASLRLTWTQNVTSKLTDVVNRKGVGEVLKTTFFIQIQDDDNPAWDALMMPFAREACPVIPEGFAAFRYKSLLSLLPSTDEWIDHYYTYEGTFAMPPCLHVKNIVFADPIYVSQKQLAVLQSLKDENGMKINNVRKLQPLLPSTKVYATIGCHSKK